MLCVINETFNIQKEVETKKEAKEYVAEYMNCPLDVLSVVRYCNDKSLYILETCTNTILARIY